MHQIVQIDVNGQILTNTGGDCLDQGQMLEYHLVAN